MGHPQKRWIRLLAVSSLGVGLSIGVTVATAQVIADPGGNVVIATNGEPARASLIAVSNGGSASVTGRNVYQPVCPGPFSCSFWFVPGLAAVSTSGTATSSTGFLAVSLTACTSGDIALSGTGCAIGTAGDSSAGLSGTGCASGDVAVNAVKCSGDSGNVYQNQGPGSANGGAAAVSGTGSATSQIAAVSVGGHSWACGGPVTVSASVSDTVNDPFNPQQNSCAGTVPFPVGVQVGGVSVQ